MATIYDKVGDSTLILAPREAMIRQFNFGAWNELRIGVFFNYVTSAGDNTVCVNETVTINTVLDRLAFGIKNSDTTTIPGQTGSNFIGVLSSTGTISLNTSNQVTVPKGTVSRDTTITQPGTGVMNSPNANGSTASASTNYAGFYCLKIRVQNLGLSTQTVIIDTANVENPGGPYDLGALRSQITTFGGSPDTSTSPIAWNDGTTAYPLPDCFFLRYPFLNNRIRLSAIEMVRIS